MDQPFAQLVNSTGCYASRCGATYIQYPQQSYLTCDVHYIETARTSVIRAILRADRLDRALRARIECFLFRALTVKQWARVAQTGVDKVVKQYAEAVKANASLHLSVVASSAYHHEKEL